MIIFFLCKGCYKNNNKNKIHKHNDFFEIIYPKEVIRQYQENIKNNQKYNYIMNIFYNLINNIFFENGNISLKSFNDSDIKDLKQICKDMKSISQDPNECFSEYKKVFINTELKKLKNENERKIILEKEALFIDKLNRIINMSFIK